MEKKAGLRNILCFFSKILLITGIVVVFYKLPSIVAEKISYWKLKNRDISQGLEED